MTQDHYIIELQQVGDYIKVSAIDPETYTEASIVGSPKLSVEELSKVAVKKLEYVMNKNKESDEK